MPAGLEYHFNIPRYIYCRCETVPTYLDFRVACAIYVCAYQCYGLLYLILEDEFLSSVGSHHQAPVIDHDEGASI